jgi:hypothetical protein
MLLLTTSPLVLFNVIPVQAQTPVSFRTPTPASGALPCSSTGPGVNAALDFDAQGTASTYPPGTPLQGTITGGTFQITSRPDGQILYSGNIRQGQVREYNGQMTLALASEIDRFPTNSTSTCPSSGEVLEIDALCSIEGPTGPTQTSINVNLVNLEKKLYLGDFMGEVVCFDQPQDTDGDGVPAASDKCPNTPNPRCFKEAT